MDIIRSQFDSKRMIATSISVGIATTFTSPFEVVKTLQQVGTPESQKFFGVWREVFYNSGVTAFWKVIINYYFIN
jgi:hypothetical protein